MAAAKKPAKTSPTIRAAHAYAPGEVMAFPFARGGWGAVQVLRALPTFLDVVALDHWSEAPPTGDTLSRAVLEQRSFLWSRGVLRAHVLPGHPADFVSLGVGPFVCEADDVSNMALDWEDLRDAAAKEFRARALPDEAWRAARAVYEAPEHSVSLALPGGAVSVRASVGSLDVAVGAVRGVPGRPLRIAEGGALDASVFCALPCVFCVSVWGDPRPLLPWVARSPLLRELRLEALPGGAYDLSALTGLDAVTVRAEAPASVRLPPSIDALHLDARRAPCELSLDGVSPALAVTLHGAEGDPLASLAAFERVTDLTVCAPDALDGRALARLTALRRLTLEGPGGSLTHADALASLVALERLQLRAVRTVDAAAMPAPDGWPRLREARASAVLDEESAVLKRRWAKDPRVSVVSPSKAAWFEEFAPPVFRAWLPHEGGAALASAWVRAQKLHAKKGDGEQAMAGFAKAVTAMEAQRAEAPFTARERADLRDAWTRLAEAVGAAETVRAPAVCG